MIPVPLLCTRAHFLIPSRASYKVAKVEQMENAVGKSIREKAEKGSKEDKIIRRELTCVLTAATLTDPGMLSDDMATHCLAIKVTTLC